MAFEPGSELERAHKVRMVWIAPDEEGDGRIGEATGDGRRATRVGREVEVWRYGRRWAELVSVVSAGQRGWQRRRGKRHNLVNEGSGDYALRLPLIETKRLLG